MYSNDASNILQKPGRRGDKKERGKKCRKFRRTANLYETIIKSMAVIHHEMYYLDLVKDTYYRIYPEMEENADSMEAICNPFTEGAVHEEDREAAEKLLSMEYIRKELKDADYIEMKYRHKTEEGAYEWCLLSITAAEWKNGWPVTAVAAIRSLDDVIRGEERQRERLQIAAANAEIASKAKSEFLSSMSHDIRTPMNAILGMAEVAAMHIDDKNRVKDALDKIKSSGKYLLGLINNILDMSRIESGKITLTETAFNLAKSIEDLLSLFYVQMKQKHLELNLNMDGLKQKEVIGDAQRLQQVFVNIMGNAVKFTPDGGKLGLCVRELPSEIEECGQYEFVFEDTGIGMEQEFMDKIFEPFERAEDSRVGLIEGSGLGMSIVQNSVHMMGGNIKVESMPGKGSRFTVKMHLKLNRKKASDLLKCTKNESEPASSKERDFTGKKVLLAEDNGVNIEVARELLGVVGIEVDVVVNGQEAVDKVRAMPPQTYDLIFMDVQMPVKNGYDATREIRSSKRDDLKQIPVIAMTADAFEEDVAKAMKVGMNGHISKPVDMLKLNHTLEEWIGQ